MKTSVVLPLLLLGVAGHTSMVLAQSLLTKFSGKGIVPDQIVGKPYDEAAVFRAAFACFQGVSGYGETGFPADVTGRANRASSTGTLYFALSIRITKRVSGRAIVCWKGVFTPSSSRYSA